jgi:thymidylate kinase
VNGFTVLLGPDFAGKSAVMTALSRRDGWDCVSVDPNLLAPRHAAIGRLRRLYVEDILSSAPGTFTPELHLSLMQCAVVHLRDRVACSSSSQIIVDSYYYKILAKCLLAGLDGHPVLQWWRTFPQPRRAVFLEVAPATAWERADHGASLNPSEHGLEGGQIRFAAFQAYQEALTAAMRHELVGVPTVVIEQRRDLDQTIDAVLEAL